MISAQHAMAEPSHLVEQAPDGMREWSIIEELDWFCFNHPRTQVLRFFRSVGERHGFIVVDCQEFKRQRFWK